MVTLFSDHSAATEAAYGWTTQAFDIMDQSRRTTSPSLEDIQASVILSFLAYNIEGAPARSRSVWSSTLSRARELSLHKVDAKSSTFSTQDDIIVHEIKRRLWWYLASSDWFVPFLRYHSAVLIVK
jgi:hypothetical protein